MRRLYLMATGVMLACQGAFGLDLDFNHGIPAEVRLYDLDALSPAADLQFTGLAPGTAWTACDVERTGSRVAVSTSWYQPSGKGRRLDGAPSCGSDSGHRTAVDGEGL